MSAVIVVAGLFISHGKVFMGLRNANDRRPALWEYPGGKVEKGEDERQALHRELMEELSVDVSVQELLSVVTLPLERRCHVLLYRVYRCHGQLEPRVHDKIGWFNPKHAIEWMAMSPATFAFYPDVEAAVRKETQRAE